MAQRLAVADLLAERSVPGHRLARGRDWPEVGEQAAAPASDGMSSPSPVPATTRMRPCTRITSTWWPYSSLSTSERTTSPVVPLAARPPARYTTESMTGSSGFISWAEMSTETPRSAQTLASRAMISCALRMSRLASGSSSSSSRGLLISACAIMTRCCSPPDRLADPLVGEALGVHGAQHLVDLLALGPAGQRQAEPVPVQAQADQVAGADRHVRVELDLLRHVADQALAGRVRLTADADRARGRRGQPEDDPQQGRLPGAVGADQADELAGADAGTRRPAACPGRRAGRSGHRRRARRRRGPRRRGWRRSLVIASPSRPSR